MTLLMKRSVILAKAEGSYDSDPSPTGSDAVAVENLVLSWPPDIVHPKIGKPSLSPIAPIIGRKFGVIEFDVPIKGSGSAGTAAEWGPLMEACGMEETIVGGTSVTYTPEDDPNTSSVWIAAYRDGLLYEFSGCRGNVTFSFAAGQRAMIHFRMVGHPVDLVDAALPSPTFDDVVSPLVIGASFSIGGFSAVIATLEVDMQNVVAPADSVNATAGKGGYGPINITDRDPAGSFDPEAELVADNDFWSQWEDSTEQALSIAVNGGAGNIATFTAPAVVDRELNEGDREGILTYQIPFTCAESSGDDEVSLAMT